MSNGQEVCCALGICCPTASEARTEALAKILTDNAQMNKVDAHDAAHCVLTHFDLAPKGFADMLRAAGNHARQHGHD